MHNILNNQEKNISIIYNFFRVWIIFIPLAKAKAGGKCDFLYCSYLKYYYLAYGHIYLFSHILFFSSLFI